MTLLYGHFITVSILESEIVKRLAHLISVFSLLNKIMDVNGNKVVLKFAKRFSWIIVGKDDSTFYIL